MNKISPNLEKTEFMVIVNPRKTNNLEFPAGLKLNDCEINRVEKTKSLGIIIDEQLDWDEKFERHQKQNEYS